MEQEVEKGMGRDIAGVTTRLIVQYVRSHAGEEGVAELITRSGCDHLVDLLEDESAWFPHQSVLALLDAAATVLGDPQAGRRIGEEVMRQRVGTPIVLLLRALGSPSQVVRLIARTSAKFQTVGDAVAHEVRSSSAVVAFRMRPGFARHPLHCDYMAGLLSQVSVLFGLPPALVAHEVCAVSGAAECVYRLSWQRHRRFLRGSHRGRLRAAEEQASALSEQLAQLQLTVADLVSVQDVPSVLARVASRASMAVRAQAFVLAVHADGAAEASVHSVGLARDVARQVADELLGPVTASASAHVAGSRLVVDVVSARRHYGRLAAVYTNGEGFFPHEHELLSAYAAVAAAALDAATALEEARQRGETATVLLELARALADAVTEDEVIRRVAGAVPALVGADGAVVWLRTPGTDSLRCTALEPATLGGGETAEVLTAAGSEDVAGLLAGSSARTHHVDDGDPAIRRLLGRAGLRQATSAPVVVRGEVLGVVSALWRRDHEGAGDPHVLARMRGLADQAATALDGARLLEAVTHPARHDSLTGLPNRALLLDRLHQAIEAARRTGRIVGVCFIDLDGFKAVNDTFGHDGGDDLIRQVGARLLATTRSADTVARLGGDEFVLLTVNAEARADVVSAAVRALGCFDAPFTVDGHELAVATSIGVAVSTDDGDDGSTLLKNADLAMYRAKALGRGRIALYEPAPANDADEAAGCPGALPAACRPARSVTL